MLDMLSLLVQLTWSCSFASCVMSEKLCLPDPFSDINRWNLFKSPHWTEAGNSCGCTCPDREQALRFRLSGHH